MMMSNTFLATKRKSDKNWNNTWRFQFGAEYALTDSVDLCGYVYDQSPGQYYEDYAVPCTDRQIRPWAPAGR